MPSQSFKDLMSEIDLETKEYILRMKHDKKKEKIKANIKKTPPAKEGLFTNINTKKLLQESEEQ